MRARSNTHRRDAGYALVAAVTSVAVFAYVALMVLAADRGALATVAGRIEQAKLAVAADAGVAMAAAGLSAPDRGDRWPIDGRIRRAAFAGMDLAIEVEDERGKAPLNSLTDDQIHALLAGAGASGERLEALVAEFKAWQVENTTPALAAMAMMAPPPGPPVRHGNFKTVEELAGLKDMTPTLLSRIAPVSTALTELHGPFEPANAKPLAIAAMHGDQGADFAQLSTETMASTLRPNIEIARADKMVGRNFTVRVTARDKDGSRGHRTVMIQLTGDPARPYWIRYVD